MPTLVNVGGATRSGTTMLDLMLGNASDAFSCGEVYTWFRPWRAHHFKLNCRCGQEPCPVWEKIRHVSEHQFYATVFKALEVNYVIDSSKELCWLIDSQNWAINHDIKVFKLVLWKNPIDLAYSHWKRNQGLDGWRQEFVSYYTKFFETGLPFRSVYFNDLVNEPSKKLAEICEIVGIPYFDGKERFWEKQHHHLRGSHGTYEQMAKGKSLFRASENFPPEFEKHITDLSQRIARDSAVQQILQTLQHAEVANSDGFRAEDQRSVSRQSYPLWYYARKARQLYRRYFPTQTKWVT